MKINFAQCHLFVSGNKCEHMWAKIGDENRQQLTMEVQRKLTVLMTIRKYLHSNMLRILFETCSIIEIQIIRPTDYTKGFLA